MKVFVRPAGNRRSFSLLVGVVGLVLVSLAMIAARASAAETLYWDNYSAEPSSVSFANIDGSGGGALNLAGAEVKDPEGMAYDTALNRLYVASEFASAGEEGQIRYINLDGSGGGALVVPGAPVIHPEGVTIDPSTQTAYWINSGTMVSGETIAFARLDGSAGGTLNTTGATLEGAYRIALDPVAGRVYWSNNTMGPSSISFANTNGSGGGNLNIGGATPPEDVGGIAVDPAGGRVYWINGNSAIVSFANLNNSGGGDIATAGAVINDPFQLAFDPTVGKFFWGNYENREVRENAIGVGLLAGGGGGITPVTAPSNGVQDPVVIKLPAGTAAPVVTRGATPAQLACSTGTWGADFAGSFVYRAPRTYAYQWALNGAAIPGATATTYTASGAGSYECSVTATNQAGTATQTSLAAPVTAATLTLKLKSLKAKAKAGKAGVIKVALSNAGNLPSAPLRLCAKLTKKAKKGLKAPKCSKVAALSAGASTVAALRVHTRPTAVGTYKFTVLVKGIAVAPLKARLKVTAKKAKH